MTDRSEGFLARWARLKTEAVAPQPAPAPVPDALPGPAPAPAEAGEADEEDPFDLDSLPPVETLGRDSDYSAFLHRKVPDALRRAALRRAWTSDPAITGYKPLVEYDWDFNAPGYGALRATDNAAEVAAALFRHLRRDAVAVDPAADDHAAAAEPGAEVPEAMPVRPESPPDADDEARQGAGTAAADGGDGREPSA